MHPGDGDGARGRLDPASRRSELLGHPSTARPEASGDPRGPHGFGRSAILHCAWVEPPEPVRKPVDVTRRLPRYDELPIRDGLPPRSAWGVFEDARRGALELLGRDEALAGLACARSGEVHRLDLDLAAIDPPLFGRAPLRHTVLGELGGGSHDDELALNTQSVTQWDGFRHIAHPEHGHFGGLADEEHGIDAAAGGIVGRGVLLDVGRALANAGRGITVDDATAIDVADLEGTIADARTELRRGDVLCVRTGWLSWYWGLDAPGRRACADDLRCCGLRPSDELFAFLWDHHVAAVCTDTPALEPWPMGAHLDSDARRSLRDAGRVDLIFGHFAILALLGIPIGELFDLDGWAAAAAGDGRTDALFVSAPLVVQGGVASPPNALVIR